MQGLEIHNAKVIFFSTITIISLISTILGFLIFRYGADGILYRWTDAMIIFCCKGCIAIASRLMQKENGMGMLIGKEYEDKILTDAKETLIVKNEEEISKVLTLSPVRNIYANPDDIHIEERMDHLPAKPSNKWTRLTMGKNCVRLTHINGNDIEPLVVSKKKHKSLWSTGAVAGKAF